MTTESWPRRGTTDHETVRYAMMGTDPRFVRLKRRFQRFTLTSIALFLGWYFLYVMVSAFGRDLMGQRVAGNINVALIFGVLQFASTFLLAWVYARYSKRHLDPLADRIRAELDLLAHGPAPRADSGAYRPRIPLAAAPRARTAGSRGR